MDFDDLKNSGVAEMARNIKEKMLDYISDSHSRTVTASAGGGMVTVVMNMNHQVVSLGMEKEVVNPDDIEMLRDLIISAVNQASEQVIQEMSRKLGDMATQLKFDMPPE
ncbi:MAG: YbaB/EbfC family nucleoid-associated protein [Deltaproteobacteria bacterium]|jgi:DNA-binding YbaB/EbfC family protein|nr:YbaB/EbfC family nucleoid-associated protein [Deltaproteobacteria bacterium]